MVEYDEDLAVRIREIVAQEAGLTQRRMFGGLAFLINGNLAVSASGHGGLLVRVDPAETATLLRRAGTAPFVMRGRPMDGWLRVSPPVLNTRRRLAAWVARGVGYARTLPPARSR